ncbi:MAG: bifunctional tetrahydrofolate synthase/dihydrofolate synthase [Legionella sp.]|uniref:bifunctional tetrahydrofolate synthase/dihydrofolate synthase n=1 Tax=Legionella sp. TaxID=459 RepID=UPI0039E62054
MMKPNSEWELAQWLSDLETRNVQEIQLGLDRILEVAQKLQLDVASCPVITVAGTNGKGSTVAALEQIYHSAGYKVGAYTSPHLLHFNERIRVGLQPITDHELCQIFYRIDRVRGTIVLTYFEMTTLTALWYFKRSELDVIILEVGLGGRLDATNILDADVAIITTIDFDHQDFLGITLEAIGYEKAGILRQGKPFIYADEEPPTTVIKVASDYFSQANYLGLDYIIKENVDDWNLHYGARHLNHLPKPAIHLKSAAAAIIACLILESRLPVFYEQIQKALSNVFIPGRLQLEEGLVSVLYDVSHNSQSVQLLAEKLQTLNTQGKIHAIFSALKDKDIPALIMPLKDKIDCWYPAQLDVKRAISANLLLSYFKNAEISVEICYNSPVHAFEIALNQAKPGDLIVVYGSFFTVGHVMAARSNRRFDETSNG